jgi:hypothetical protein
MGLNIGNIYFIGFDPYKTLYDNSSKTRANNNLRAFEEADPSLAGLAEYL